VPRGGVAARIARALDAELLDGVHSVIAQGALAPDAHAGRFGMGVAMTNCGALGWVSDRGGYRYAPLDPLSAHPWPNMPADFGSWPPMLPCMRASRIFNPTSASSIVMRRARAFHCIRTAMSATTHTRSSRFRLG